MRKRNIFLAVLLAVCLAVTMSAQAADLVANIGIPNSSGVAPIQVDTDRAVTIDSSSTLSVAGDVALTGGLTLDGNTINTPINATIALSAGAATDEMDILITSSSATYQPVEIWISDDPALTLTGTSASGALTITSDGGFITTYTANKHALAVTAATGTVQFSLVDSANTAGEIVVIRMPDGSVTQSAASVGTDYEGGS